MIRSFFDPSKVVTGEARMSHCYLLHPRVNQSRPGVPPRFGVTLMIPKSDTATMARIHEAIDAAMDAGMASRWNNVRPATPATPIWDGDGPRENGRPFGPECGGCWVITATSIEKPGIVDSDLQHVTVAEEIYSGMYGRASIRFFAYNNNGKKGIGCGLLSIQKLRDGEPLSVRSTPEEDFAEPAQEPERKKRKPVQRDESTAG